MHNRVKISTLVQDQLPIYIRDSYPDFVQFLSNYYKSLEHSGGSLDIVNNIDDYVKVENISEITYFTDLSFDVDYSQTNIMVSDTSGFPEQDGLIQINDEVIFYEAKTSVAFINCKRGFSGITSYSSSDSSDLIFTSSLRNTHSSGSVVYKLFGLFLAELYK